MNRKFVAFLTLFYQYVNFKVIVLSAIWLLTGCHLNANHNNYKTNTTVKELEIGDTIPNIVLKDQNGEMFDLKSKTKSKNVVLYFYPKDNTKGCTAQACSFRDQITEFNNIDAVVIGISSQSVQSHKKFAEDYNLPSHY